MPCEGCASSFTVFRRKHSCADCKRFYCSSCLTASRRKTLCERCAVFAKRPLFRADLLQLKPKDLIFYLQSKHISTAGCVEKDELVGLVLTHIQQTEASSPNNSSSASGSSRSGADHTNSFDNLKQTCQNFFTSISDNISDSFAAFDGSKGNTKSQPNNTNNSNSSRQGSARTNNTGATHIFNQPRVCSREMPTYASFQNYERNVRQATTPTSPTSPVSLASDSVRIQSQGGLGASQATSPHYITDITSIHGVNNGQVANNRGSSATSPVHSTNSQSNSSSSVSQPATATVQYISTLRCEPMNDRQADKSECQCSDGEIFAAFNERMCIIKDDSVEPNMQVDDIVPAIVEKVVDEEEEQTGDMQNDVADTLPSSSSSTNARSGKLETYSSKVEFVDDVSSHSSFEELGAIGGISDESKTTTDTNSSNTDQWQFLDTQLEPTLLVGEREKEVEKKREGQRQREVEMPQKVAVKMDTDNAQNGNEAQIHVVGNDPAPSALPTTEIVRRVDTLQLMQIAQPADGTLPPQAAQRVKKVTRRRSDGYLNRRRRQPSDDESSAGSDLAARSFADTLTLVREEEPMISDQTGSETMQPRISCKRCGKHKSLRRHVEKMRRHLESSQMCEEDIKRELAEFLAYLEIRTTSLDHSDTETAVSTFSVANSMQTEYAPLSPPPAFNDNEGIHVYAASPDYGTSHDFSRFINLEDFDTLQDLESLTVKQLKEVLMLNRVDYKGCCEKQELLDRVERLWKNLKSTPAVDKLHTDELCKICMDAPIECIILECGHMATCTSCGKVLSECPICRQYIVRVVRFFRA